MDVSFLVNQIEMLCNQKGITIKDMLYECNLNRNVISNMKKKTKPSIPSVDKILPIAKYFNVSVDYLLTGKEPTKSGISKDEKEFLNVYNKLDEKNKILALGYMQGLIAAGGNSASIDKDIPEIVGAVADTFAKITNTD